MSESEIEIVIKCKCGNLLTEMKRETESMYGDRLAITVEPCKVSPAMSAGAFAEETRGRGRAANVWSWLDASSTSAPSRCSALRISA